MHRTDQVRFYWETPTFYVPVESALNTSDGDNQASRNFFLAFFSATNAFDPSWSSPPRTRFWTKMSRMFVVFNPKYTDLISLVLLVARSTFPYWLYDICQPYRNLSCLSLITSFHKTCSVIFETRSKQFLLLQRFLSFSFLFCRWSKDRLNFRWLSGPRRSSRCVVPVDKIDIFLWNRTPPQWLIPTGELLKQKSQRATASIKIADWLPVNEDSTRYALHTRSMFVFYFNCQKKKKKEKSCRKQ